MHDTENLDKEIRYVIYKTFVETARAPTTQTVARHLETTIHKVEQSFQRLADAHHIALAPGGFSIWMAHPFSSLQTNFTVDIGSKTYFAN